MKKEHTWGTPKRVVIAETEIPDKLRKQPNKKGKCKITKGEHKYSLVEQKYHLKGIFESICLCGKKDHNGNRYSLNGELLAWDEYWTKKKGNNNE